MVIQRLSTIKGHVRYGDDREIEAGAASGAADSRGVTDKSGLAGIKVRLFAVLDRKQDGSGVTVSGEKLVGSACTDRKGTYCFCVPEGEYSLELDPASLPEGTCAAGCDKRARAQLRDNTDFLVVRKNGPLPEEVRMSYSVAPPVRCSVEKVELACRNGEIDEHKKILYTLYSVFDKDKLPGEYRSKAPLKSGTGPLDQIRRYAARPDADKGVLEMIDRAVSSSVPALDKSYISPGGYFNIHYTLNGSNAVPHRYGGAIPSYIRLMGQAFDHVRAFTCGTRGFRLPVGEPDKKAMDIYVYDQKGIYGYTRATRQSETEVKGVRTASCYICLDNNYSSEKGFQETRNDCMRVTAAHEFFHAVQYAYNVDADTWWKEASATWNEDEVYTGVNDYVRYIPGYFSAPDKTLEKSSYGGVVFVKYLSENMGGYRFIRKIWEDHAAAARSSVTVIDGSIRSEQPGWDLGSAFNRFTAFNYNPAQYYKEGAQWKARVAVKDVYGEYPVPREGSRLDHLSACYCVFRPAGGVLKLAVSGEGRTAWGFKVQKRMKASGKCSLTEVELGRKYDRAQITIDNFGEDYSELCLIPANLGSSLDHMRFSYSAYTP